VQANLGVMYSQLRLRDKAKTHLEAALALSPDNADVLAKAGEAYENLGERSLALTYFRKALQKGSTLADLEANPDFAFSTVRPQCTPCAAQSIGVDYPTGGDCQPLILYRMHGLKGDKSNL
jgi:tetratricopeptide (TPR) repeat protein